MGGGTCFVVSVQDHGFPEFEAESQSALLNPALEALNNSSLPDSVSIKNKTKQNKKPHNPITSQRDEQSPKKYIFGGRFAEYLPYQFTGFGLTVFSSFICLTCCLHVAR